MRLFDAYLFVDWSARSKPSSARECADAVWVGEGWPHHGGGPRAEAAETYFRTRSQCGRHLRERLADYAAQGWRLLVGFDFPFGYPAGFASALGVSASTSPWRSVWDLLSRLVEDGDGNENNRFEVAAQLNVRCNEAPPGRADLMSGLSRPAVNDDCGRVKPGPLWGCPAARAGANLGPRSPGFPYGPGPDRHLERLRSVDRRLRVQEAWKLMGAGSVGGQALLGIPCVDRLRDDPRFKSISSVWPFETGFTDRPVPTEGPWILFAEVWPGTVRHHVDRQDPIRDRAQVRALVQWAADLDSRGALGACFDLPAGLSARQAAHCIEEEGWILGA
jgi:hypothetical protein